MEAALQGLVMETGRLGRFNFPWVSESVYICYLHLPILIRV